MEIVQVNSIKAWLLAARPKTLAGAATPVLLGCALAYADSCFQMTPALLCFAFAFLMQIDANFINDYFDYLKGSDREDRLGPERACAQGWITLNAMRKGIALTTATACLAGLCLLAYGGIEMIPVGILCVLFAFLYTAGPYPLAYHGWGDILVIVFFGFVPVGCTYYVMCRDWTWNVTLASLACGLIIDTLLMVNNYRDRDQDAKSGKKTIVVRWGANAGQQLYLFLGLAAAWLCLLFIPTGHIWAALLPQIYLLPHFMAWQRMVKIKQGKRIKQHIGRNLPQYAAIRRITSIRPYPIIFQQDLARRYFPIKRNKSFRFLYQYSGISGNALLPARKSQFLCSGSLYGNIIHINPHQMSKYQLHFRNPRFQFRTFSTNRCVHITYFISFCSNQVHRFSQ